MDLSSKFTSYFLFCIIPLNCRCFCLTEWIVETCWYASLHLAHSHRPTQSIILPCFQSLCPWAFQPLHSPPFASSQPHFLNFFLFFYKEFTFSPLSKFMHFLFPLSHSTPSASIHTHIHENTTETAGSLAAVARSQKVCNSTDPKCASDPVMAQSTPPSASLLLSHRSCTCTRTHTHTTQYSGWRKASLHQEATSYSNIWSVHEALLILLQG